jgi:hypothetical protein
VAKESTNAYEEALMAAAVRWFEDYLRAHPEQLRLGWLRDYLAAEPYEASRET